MICIFRERHCIFIATLHKYGIVYPSGCEPCPMGNGRQTSPVSPTGPPSREFLLPADLPDKSCMSYEHIYRERLDVPFFFFFWLFMTKHHILLVYSFSFLSCSSHPHVPDSLLPHPSPWNHSVNTNQVLPTSPPP